MDSPLILLVDHTDGPLFQQDSVLRRKGKSVCSATSGREALARIRRDQPRLVIFSYQLPDMAAPELCRLIREEPATRPTSLLFVAEAGSDTFADLCMAAGCNDVLYRPILWSDLEDRIEKLTAIPLRKELRTLMHLSVDMRESTQVHRGESMSVSVGGMLLETDQVLPPEARLELTFYLPGEIAPVTTRAQVVRAEFVGVKSRYGVRFLELASTDKHRIEQYIKRNRAGAAP